MCGSVRLCHTNWSRRIRHCTCAPVSCWPAMAALFHCCCCCLLEHLSFAKYSQSMAMMRLCVLCVCVCLFVPSLQFRRTKWKEQESISMYSLVKLVRQTCAKSKQRSNGQTNETAVAPNMASESEFVVWVWQLFIVYFVAPMWAVLQEGKGHTFIVNLAAPAQSKLAPFSVGVCLYVRLVVITDWNMPLWCTMVSLWHPSHVAVLCPSSLLSVIDWLQAVTVSRQLASSFRFRAISASLLCWPCSSSSFHLFVPNCLLQ